MSNFFYSIYTFFSRTKYKLEKNKFFKFFINSKIIWIIMWIFFIALVWLYYYSIHHHYFFQRKFNKVVFPINNIENKILFLLIINSIYFILVFLFKVKLNFLKNKLDFIKKIKFKKTLWIYIIYSIIIYFLSFIELKTKALFIITPIVFYFVYNIYNYIKENKTKFRFKFLIDSRYFFLIALILLIYTPIFIYFKDQKLAEKLSIYAYYFLVFWVSYELITTKFQK